MSKKQITVAIAYDFDGTLAPGNMQERNFIPEIGMNNLAFWKEVEDLCLTHQADNILMYMWLMLQKADSKQVQVFRKNITDYGKQLKLFPGVEHYDTSEHEIKNWFQRINEYGKECNIKIEHYIISSGLREMIEGTTIKKEFKKIYASSFYYDHHNIAAWPALAINYTTKTQYLFRINKGILDVNNNKEINDFQPKNERPVPFSNIIFIGDGETDIPCFRLVRDQGGHSIVVYQPSKKGARGKANKIIEQQRADFLAAADYREGETLDRIVKAIIDKIQTDYDLNRFTSHRQ